MRGCGERSLPRGSEIPLSGGVLGVHFAIFPGACTTRQKGDVGVSIPPWSVLSGSLFGLVFGVFVVILYFGLGSAAGLGICEGCSVGSPRGDGGRWTSSRVVWGIGGTWELQQGESRFNSRIGSPTSGKQSQPCHHSNGIAASGLTICFKICAFPSWRCREEALNRDACSSL